MNHKDTDEIVISAKNVSKKFCKNLKRSLAYGIVELSKNLIGVIPDSTTLRRDEFWALNDISFELRRGEVLGVIGENGSGKTTLLRLLAGIFPPDKGEIMIRGKVGALIALGAGFHPHMTGIENIYLNGTILGMSKREIDKRLEEIIDFAEIGDFIEAPVSVYSSGMRVRLGFSVAAYLDPDVLLIDEVLAVGDISFRSKCFNAIDKLTKNAAVIFVSHQMPQVSRICSKIFVLDKGIPVCQSSNVMEGIDYFFSNIKAVKQSISGTGRAEVHKTKIYSDNSEESTNGFLKIQYLDNLYIEVSFSLSSEIQKAVMNIAFFSRDERGVAQCYSNICNFEVVNSGDIITTRVKIPKLQLNPGIYSISIVLVDSRRGETLINVHAMKNIQVLGSSMGFAPLQLQGEWQYV
jgi:lipopolysaccharide transport system ATP-binding protein